jgi:hypothetical protein
MSKDDLGPDVESDGFVRTALQLLPIPAHDDDFWVRLEAALDAEGGLAEPRRTLVAAARPSGATEPPATGLPAPLVELDPSLAVVPPAFRRTSNAVLAAVAAAAIVIVAVAGTTLLDDERGTTVGTAEPAADAALETLVQDAQSDGTVTTLAAAREDESSEAVLQWVDDLGAGDGEAAWAAMGDVSQAHFVSQAEFEGLMTDLAEGYGAWSAAQPDEILVTPVAAGDDGTIAVVTLIGTVEQEGTAQHRTDAFPVRIVDGDVVLEPFASAGTLEVVIPEPPSDDGVDRAPVGTTEELVFVLPSDAGAPVLRIDGGDTVICGEGDGSELGSLDQALGQRCAYLPDGGFEVGAHTVTIAFLGPDGESITAESIHFEAAA